MLFSLDVYLRDSIMHIYTCGNAEIMHMHSYIYTHTQYIKLKKGLRNDYQIPDMFGNIRVWCLTQSIFKVFLLFLTFFSCLYYFYYGLPFKILFAGSSHMFNVRWPNKALHNEMFVRCITEKCKIQNVLQ